MYSLSNLIAIAYFRVRGNLGHRLALALGVLLAALVVSASILYAEAAGLAVLRDRLSQAQTRYDLIVKGTRELVDPRSYEETTRLLSEQIPTAIGIPITVQGRHGLSRSLVMVREGEQARGNYVNLPRARVQFYADYQGLVDVVEGRWPEPVRDPQRDLEALITRDFAEKMKLSVGDRVRLELFQGQERPQGVWVRVVGITAPRAQPDTRALYYAPHFLDESFLVPEETFFRALTVAIVPAQAEFTWVYNLDIGQITVDNAAAVLAGIDRYRFLVTSQLDDIQFLTTLDNALQDYRKNTAVLRAMLLLFGAPVVGIAFYYVVMAASLIVFTQREEIGVLKSRGASTSQILLLYVFEIFALALLAVLIVPPLAIPVAQAIAHASSFLRFDLPRSVPVTLRPAIRGYVLLTALLAGLAILLPVIRASRESIVTVKQSRARPRETRLAHRVYLDILLLILAAIGYRTLTQSGSIVTRGSGGELQIDPLLLATPVVAAAGLGLFFLRVAPWLLRGLAWMAAHSDGLILVTAWRELSRRSDVAYGSLLLLLIFTLALGLFTASVAGTFDLNYAHQALYRAGTDLRVSHFNFEALRWEIKPLDWYTSLPGVRAVSPALRVRLVGRPAEVRAKGTLLAVDPETFAEAAWWRDDFASTSLAALLDVLRQNPRGVWASQGFGRRYRLQPGDSFDMDVDGIRVDFVFLGEIRYFPTLDPTKGDFVVANLNYVQEATGFPPGEAWLKISGGQRARERVKAILNGLGDTLNLADGHELAGIRGDDPLRTGLFGALSVGFIVATLLSVLGFLLYAYVTIRARMLQFGVLRAQGLLSGQLAALLAVEQITLVGLGVLTGTALGVGSSDLFTRFLRVSIIAREAVPPFQIVTPWGLMARVYLILALILLAGLVTTMMMLRRLQVYAILRLGEA
ncbi:MAG: ABC transporter permease [Chloroflexi bacterium]|nr:ABC transporter permease [Chloroflexota bacterium]